MVEVEGKGVGEADPAKGGKNSSRKLKPQALLPVRDYRVQAGKDDGQDG